MQHWEKRKWSLPWKLLTGWCLRRTQSLTSAFYAHTFTQSMHVNKTDALETSATLTQFSWLYVKRKPWSLPSIMEYIFSKTECGMHTLHNSTAEENLWKYMGKTAHITQTTHAYNCYTASYLLMVIVITQNFTWHIEIHTAACVKRTWIRTRSAAVSIENSHVAEAAHAHKCPVESSYIHKVGRPQRLR